MFSLNKLYFSINHLQKLFDICHCSFAEGKQIVRLWSVRFCYGKINDIKLREFRKFTMNSGTLFILYSLLLWWHNYIQWNHWHLKSNEYHSVSLNLKNAFLFQTLTIKTKQAAIPSLKTRGKILIHIFCWWEAAFLSHLWSLPLDFSSFSVAVCLLLLPVKPLCKTSSQAAQEFFIFCVNGGFSPENTSVKCCLSKLKSRNFRQCLKTFKVRLN